MLSSKEETNEIKSDKKSKFHYGAHNKGELQADKLHESSLNVRFFGGVRSNSQYLLLPLRGLRQRQFLLHTFLELAH